MNDEMTKIRLRVLNPKFDMKYYRTAWNWRENKPDWFIESMQTWKMTQKEYFENIFNENQIDYGIFKGSRFIGVITFDVLSAGLVEGHLDCEENADFADIEYALWLIIQHAFENGVNIGMVWVQSFNRPILKLYKKVGFQPTNISVFRGKCKNKIVEWKQFVVKNPKFAA